MDLNRISSNCPPHLAMFSMFHYEPLEPRKRRRRKPQMRRAQKRVLLVDDSTKAITPLNVIFRNLGCDTIISFDGHSAVREIINQQPDLVILDWKMPDLNGDEAIFKAQDELIKMNMSPGRLIQVKIPIITFSAYPFEELTWPDCPNFRFLDHWTKPLSFGELTANATRLLNGT